LATISWLCSLAKYSGRLAVEKPVLLLKTTRNTLQMNQLCFMLAAVRENTHHKEPSGISVRKYKKRLTIESGRGLGDLGKVKGRWTLPRRRGAIRKEGQSQIECLNVIYKSTGMDLGQSCDSHLY
jgi:hypothetical protein